jgi:quercetin dioxygenase-like cupin family protein
MSSQRNQTDELTQASFRFSNLIEYQSGSIVSRTIIDKPEGTVTVFAFDKGQNLSEHTAPFDALVQILDGEGIISIEGKAHNLKAGEAIIMPANIPHAVEADVPFKMLLTMVRSK